MAGIYIHIPFCKQRCNYCNFYSIPVSRRNTKLKEYRSLFVNALLKEIQLQKTYLENETVSTIYFGGGTPSLLTINEQDEIFNQIYKYFRIEKEIEVTLEVNPDDINIHMLKALKKIPVNRMSIGIQSFFDEDLQYLSRVHNALQAINSIKLILDEGFNNLSVDLIYGIPSLTDERWLANLDFVLQYKIPHISSYALTIEPKTTLEWLIRKGKIKAFDEQQSIQQYRIMLDRFRNKGYVNYEISNFALKGKVSKHNCNYWKGIPYLGLGPSAHSFNRDSRQWNVVNVSSYITNLTKAEIPFEKEILNVEQKYNEYVMTSLRTVWGCDLQIIINEFGIFYKDHFLQQIVRYLN
ncbi:radical SAM family heme chaperone HemW, partial [candidate division KSB1 bacterium]